MNWLAALGAIILASVCLGAGRLGIVSRFKRQTWLSLAGGVATAYLFIHLLPEIGHYRERIDDDAEGSSGGFLYVVLLCGTCIYYGIESFLSSSRRAGGRTAFVVHTAGYSLYFALIGYFLQHRGDPGDLQEVLYILVLGIHILALDAALRGQHEQLYDRIGRWVMAASVFAGWAVGAATTMPPLIIGSAFALLAGGMILNILRQELPASSDGRFLPFLVGASACAAMLVFA